jgi:two-component system response regulator YesN
MLRLIIADDEPLEREAIKLICRRFRPDYEIAGEADDGKEALQKALAIKPDVMFLDIKMPEMDGLTLASQIRGLIPDVRLVIISAYGEFAYAKKALSLGVSDYLLKPVETEEIISLLDELTKEITSEKRIKKELQHFMPSLLERWPRAFGGQFLGEVFGKEAYAEIISKAVSYVEEFYWQDLSLEGTASRFFLSPCYFSRLFKRYKGYTFSEYLILIRVKESRRLLLTTNLPVAEIAFKIGYRDARYFGQVFKKMTGMTPGSFRRLGVIWDAKGE